MKDLTEMTIEERKEYAAERKKEMNCCQAVLVAFADKLGKNEDELLRLGSGFGSGMATMEGTCGALVGAGLVLGLVNKDKAKSMKQMRQIMTRFQERNGATQCKLLKGVGTKVMLRACPDCVADAAEFLEEALRLNVEDIT